MNLSLLFFLGEPAKIYIMTELKNNRIGELHDKFKAWFVYGTFAVPLIFWVLLGPESVILGWMAHFFILLLMPRIKGEGTRWSFKRQLKWLGGSFLYGVLLVGFTDDSDEYFCMLAPEVMAEVILRANEENPRLLSEKTSAQEVVDLIREDPRLEAFENSIGAQLECLSEMSLIEAAKVAGTKPGFREILADRYDDVFSGVRRFFEENETGEHDVMVAISVDGKNGVFIEKNVNGATYELETSAIVSEIKRGSGDFLDLDVFNNVELAFLATLSVKEDDVRVLPVSSNKLRLSIDGKPLADWKKTDSAFLTAEIQETERAAEAARIAEEQRKERERLAEEERKRKEAEYERSIPKFTAYDIDTKFVLNAAGSAMKYNDEVVQVTGKVTSVEEGGFWSGGWEITSYVDNGRAVIFNVRDTPENKAKIMNLVAQRDMVTVRGKCDGDDYQVEIEKCDIIRVKRRF